MRYRNVVTSIRSIALTAILILLAAQLPVVGVAHPALAAPASRQAPPAPRAAALPANPVDYAYDAAGRLKGVAQANAGSAAARYNYDTSGNLTSIDRFTAATVSILGVVPARAAPGSTVTISGTGFATTSAGNTVKFNGTTATVATATATTLTVPVPSGATSGAITVTTSAGTATSAETFTVDAASSALTVTGFAPSTAGAGGTVTISGTGFDPTPANDTVTFGLTRAVVTAATATSLTVTVPDAATSGRLTVGTLAGATAQSGSDFVVVPRGYTPAAVGTTGVLAVDGASSTVTISTAGTVALLRFTGVKGQRLSLGLTGATISTNYTVGAFTPYGAPFARHYFGYDKPWDSAHLYGGGLELPALPSSGTYQVVIDPLGATGSVVATLSSRVTGTLSPTGAGVTANLARPGQQAELTFPAVAGQPIDLGILRGTLPSGGSVIATIRDPNGTSVFWGQDGVVYQELGTDGQSDWDFTPTQTGNYTLLFGTRNSTTGTVTVTQSQPLAPVALTLGGSTSVSINRPGQDAPLTYAGTVGQKLSLDLSAYTFAYLPKVTITAPDQSTLFQNYLSSLHLDLPTLPATGTYTITVSPESTTGSFTARLATVGDAGTVTTTGPAVTVSLSQAGSVQSLAFSATSGQPLDFAFTGWTLPSTATLSVQVTDPQNAAVATYTVSANQAIWFNPAATGTFHLRVSATNGTSTGSVSVTASAELAGGAFTIGVTKSVATSRVGQSTGFTFAGTTGQRLSLAFTSYAYSGSVVVVVFGPDNSLLRNEYIATTQLDLDPLPSTGTYRIIVGLAASTGSTQLTLAERVNAGTTTVGGAATTLSMPSTGRFAEASFTATAGQRLGFGFTGRTFSSTTQLRTRVINAAGTVLTDFNLVEGSSLDLTIATAGTYRLIVAPAGFVTGSETFTLSEQVNAGTVTIGTPKNLTFARPGQGSRVTFTGTAGQNLAVTYTNVTTTYYPSVLVKNPDGSPLTSSAGAATVNIASLPTNGVYEIDFSPYSSTGSVTMTLGTRAAAAPAPYPSEWPALQAGAPVPALSGPSGRAALPIPGARPPLRGPLGTVEAGSDTWTPDQRNLTGQDWTTHRPDPTKGAAQPSALQAKKGETALSGRVHTLDGKPLKGATVSVESTRTTTDAQGRFLLTGLKAGHRALRVDGAGASTGDRKYGLYDIGVDLAAGTTTVLPYTIWMTRLDTAHTVRFASPTTGETVITNPAIPGLEVHLPAGTTVRDADGKVVTELGITAIPVDRPPFPLPKSRVPVYFTVQPGSSTVFPAGASVVYPNYSNAPAGTSYDFWHYDAAGRGWFVYGHGKVTPDGKQVKPDPGTLVYQFTGAMLTEPGVDPPPDVAPTPDGGSTGADPVDLGTGQLVDAHTDLSLPDTMPVSVTRTYSQSDTGRRAFGIGVNLTYNIYLYSNLQWVDGYLILPDASRVHYHRITPGSTGGFDYLNAVFAADPTPTPFNGSIMSYSGNGFDIKLRDGTTYVFGEEAPLQSIRDRFGNVTTITRGPAAADPDGVVRAKGPITQVTSPNGKWIAFTNDSSGRVTKATDSTGRSVSYTYDASGFLSTVTDVNGGVTTYTYAGGRIATIKDPRGTTYLTNTYDAAGRVSRQSMADGSTYQLAYTTSSSGQVTEARLTDGRGNVRRVTFNSAGFAVTDTAAFGTSSAQTTTITRDATSNLPTASVDPLNRRTEVTYDGFGNVTGVTRLAGTSSARSSTFTYGPFDLLTRATDPLGHATTYTYAADGALRTITDPMSRVTTVETAESGQLTKVTDPLGGVTTFTYRFGDAAGATDPLGRTSRLSVDGAGRVVASTDAAGATTRIAYSKAGQALSVTDPLGRVTSYGYDPNGNRTTVTDPRGHTTTYTFDLMDRVTKVTDPLNRATSATYDANGNLTSMTSARGKVTAATYDVLDRLTNVRYGASGTTQESQTGYTYDAGDRITSIVDSAGGTTTQTWDLFDRLTRSVDPRGQVDYTFDAADRRATMTVAGQPVVTYAYDNDDQLTGETQGSTSVAVGYDGAGRMASLTLPNGVVQTYSHDAAGQVTGITYASSGTTLGNLTYARDAVGRPVHVGGTFARADIPAAFGPVTYDAANQTTAVGSTAYTYDADGNLTSDGSTTYTWNARGEMSALSRTGLSVTFGYDGLGRRSSRTTGGATTGFFYDGSNAVQELSGTSVTANRFTGPGVDDVFARTPSAGGTRSLLTDALGSTIAVGDGTGAVTAEYTYQPFGATTVSGDDAGNVTRFAGREDDGTGLYYNRARYYSPGNQRFLSADPLGFGSGDTNLYSYAFNQPTDLVDPNGTKPNSCLNSFTGDTPVLLADGSTRRIDQVKPGDKVLAADPATGRRAAEPVTAVIVGDGTKQVVQLELASGGELTVTGGHPFWVDDDGRADTPGGHWVNAIDLKTGQWLKTSDGQLVRVAGIHATVRAAKVYNLTVDELHTFYVAAGGAAVLVHNSGGVDPFGGELPPEGGWPQFTNRETGDVLQPIENVPYVSLRQLASTGSGEYIYVIMPNGELRVIPQWAEATAPYMGHFDTARGNNVIAGGKVWLENGVVQKFNNYSGHYHPKGAHLERLIRGVFRANNLRGANTAVYDPHTWKEERSNC